MSVVHIPEEEAVKDFGIILSRIDAGAEVVIDPVAGYLTLLSSGPI